MGKLTDAIEKEMSFGETDNGAFTLTTTGAKCLDFIGRAGAMRHAPVFEKTDLFNKAFKENADWAMRLLFFARDIRGGYGERDTFREILHNLAITNKESIEKNLWAVVEFGRADDLYCLIDTPAEKAMWNFMREQFELDLRNMAENKPISLLAKWIATPNSASKKTAELGKRTAQALGYSFKNMKDYRKKLTALRAYLDLPEIKMATNRWDEIEYSKLASKAMLFHRGAFYKHDEARLQEFFDSVKRGEATLNTGTLNPVDIMTKALDLDSNELGELEVMWDNMPDFVGEHENVLVMADTSGSMLSNYYNGPAPFTVAASLAIYFAERLKGELKDTFMTFSSEPKFIQIHGGTLVDRYSRILKADWGNSTNLERAFEKLLNTAVKSKLDAEDMPKAILVISDMQLDVYHGRNNTETFTEAMKQLYEGAGYKLPSVVYWNVNAAKPAFHSALNEAGTTFVSGYSPVIFKSVMECIGKTPIDYLLKIVESERYKEIVA